MKLSEAIRLGAMLGPQVFGRLGWRGLDGESCAMGAVLRASGYPTGECWRVRVTTEYPILLVKAKMPVRIFEPTQWWDQAAEDTVWFCIVELNNGPRWTRERIADWVATIEDAQEQQAQPQPAEAVQAC